MTNTAALTKTQIRSLKARVKALTAELNDETCQRFPLAKSQVQAALDATLAQLPS
jgi:hypothetical protein